MLVRVGVLENEQHANDAQVARLLNEIDRLQQEDLAEREKRSTLDNKVSSLQGEVFVFGSIVMSLQAALMIMALKQRSYKSS